MQKITLKKFHKSLPTFSLNSTRSFKVFAKTYPKHVRKLDIDCIVGRFIRPNLTKKILTNFIKLIKKSSKFKGIQDINLSQYLNASNSQALYVIKKSHRVQSLGLLWDFYNKKTQNETRKWLKYTNKLHSLVFRQTESIAGTETFIEARNWSTKLAQDLQRRKIRKIIHSILPSNFTIYDHYPFNMNSYPSTVRELSLDLSKCCLLTPFDKPISQFVAMDKFSLLTRLELLFSLEAEIVLKLIRTIPNPRLLTSLGFDIKNTFYEQDVSCIFEWIASCSEIVKLDLRMSHTTNQLELLSRLSSREKLRILSLRMQVRTDKHFKDIEDAISKAVNLESLDVTVNFISDSVTCSEVYEKISQLTKLKKLYLKFTLEQNVKIKPAYSKLTACIGNLSQLEELSLDILDLNLHEEFPCVIEGLAEIASQLKSFSMDFMGNNFSEEDELELLDLLEKMERLRELEIFRFSFKQNNQSLLRFKEVLEGFEDLKKIKWVGFEVSKEGVEVFFDLVRSILTKKGVEECNILQNYQKYPKEMKKEILFDEILERNLGLRVADIRSEIVSNNRYGFCFETCKYT